jgi:hypothetical protein
MDKPQVYIEYNVRSGRYIWGVLAPSKKIAWKPKLFATSGAAYDSAIANYPNAEIHIKK